VVHYLVTGGLITCLFAVSVIGKVFGASSVDLYFRWRRAQAVLMHGGRRENENAVSEKNIEVVVHIMFGGLDDMCEIVGAEQL